jgi:acyl-CoA thioesterase FadM
VADWIETFRGAVLASEYDPEAHMNTPLYVSRFDQATWFLLCSIGITPSSMKQQGRRVAIVRQQFQYLKELRGGELVVIQSGFVAVSKKHFRFLHRMFDIASDSMVATSDFTAVEASLKTGKSVQLPPAHRTAAEKHLVTTNVAEATGLS